MTRAKASMPSQSPEEFHFILSNPSSEVSASDLYRVRSHVRRWTWQHVRKQQRKIRREEEQRDPAACDLLNDDQIQPQNSNSPPSAPSQRHNVFDQSSYLTSPLIHSIDAELIDPFATHTTSPIPSQLVSNSNKYCLTVVWPGLMPSSWTTISHPGVQAWFLDSTVHPTLHSAMLFGAYSHRRTRWLKGEGHFSTDDMRLMALCEADVITRINALLPNTEQAVCDAVILSVFCLASNQYDFLMHRTPNSVFKPPLRSLQWLDVYGRLSPNPIHQAGLLQLIKLKGGLEKIKLPGLAAVISFGIVLTASRMLSRPQLPCFSLRTGRQMTLKQIIRNDAYVGKSGMLQDMCMTGEMHVVFQGVRAYHCLVQRFQDGMQDVDQIDLCDVRNVVQWHIMSLLPSSQLDPAITQLCPVYEICRLALMIFGIGVVFPLPLSAIQLDQLSRMMQAELQFLLDFESLHGTQPPSMMEAQCWCLVLGGMVAEPPQRAWYVEELRRVLSSLGISTWKTLKMTLHRFLWWEVSCEISGRQLWDEAIQDP